MDETSMIVALVTVLSLTLGELTSPSIVVRWADRLRGWVYALLGRMRERTRLRIAAALLDFGNHLMLCDEERRARRLEKGLSGRRARRLGLEATALRLGAARANEVTLELPVGSREQEGNPSRTLVLSCVVHHPPPDAYPKARAHDSTRSWRVVNRPSPGYRGPSTTSEIPSLGRALLAYHAGPLHPERGRRFLDEDVHDRRRHPDASGRSRAPVGEDSNGRAGSAAEGTSAGRPRP